MGRSPDTKTPAGGPDATATATADDAQAAGPDNSGATAPRTLRVDAGVPATADADGSASAPFATLNGALRVAQPHDIVQLAPGSYAESAVISVAGLTLLGRGATLEGAGGTDTLTISASHVTVEGLQIRGGQVGIRAQAPEGTNLAGLTLLEVQVADVASDTPSQMAIGIALVRVQGARLERCHVQGVRGASGALSDGGDAIGILVQASHGAHLEGCRVEDIEGGAASVQPNTNANGLMGGSALGVAVRSSVAGVAVALVVTTIRGGAGGDTAPGAALAWSGGIGGLAAGVHLVEANQPPWDQAWSFEDNTLSSLSSGESGLAHADGHRVGAIGRYGYVMDDASVDAAISSTNRVDGVPVYHLNKVSGVTLKGVTASGEGAIPTNHGYVFVRYSSDITLAGLTLGGPAPHPTLNRGRKALVEILSSQRVHVTGARFSAVVGGRALAAAGCSQVTLEDLSVDDVYSTPRTETDAIQLESCAACSLEHVRLTHLRTAALYEAPALLALSGVTSDLTVSHTTLADLQLVGDDAHFLPAALRADDGCTRCLVDQLTVVNVAGDGVRVGAAATPTVVRNAVFAQLGGRAVSGQGAAPLDYALVDAASAAEPHGPTVTVADPRFLDAAAGNFTLAPDSPGVDAGDPLADCTGEPAPNGCRVNLGAEGGSPTATPAPGADHCATCPGG